MRPPLLIEFFVLSPAFLQRSQFESDNNSKLETLPTEILLNVFRRLSLISRINLTTTKKAFAAIAIAHDLLRIDVKNLTRSDIRFLHEIIPLQINIEWTQPEQLGPYSYDGVVWKVRCSHCEEWAGSWYNCWGFDRLGYNDGLARHCEQHLPWFTWIFNQPRLGVHELFKDVFYFGARKHARKMKRVSFLTLKYRKTELEKRIERDNADARYG